MAPNSSSSVGPSRSTASKLRKQLSRRTQSFSLSPIKEMELRASKIPDAISLAQGIPYLTTPKEITEFVHEKVDAGLCDKYSLSPGLEELREELSLSLREDGQSYDPESEIIVTAGSIQGMTATLLTLLEKGDEVLVPSPTYASYIGSIYLAEGTPKHVPLNEDAGFDISVEAFEEAMTSRTKALLLCIPNNPTGTVFSSQTLEALLRLAYERGIYVIVDEVYKDFYFRDVAHVSPAHFPWAQEHVIRVCSFSKAYAMTGWRVGFLAAPQPVAQELLKVHDVMVSCAPVVSQYAALAALRFGDEARLRFIEEFRERRDLTVAYLDQMSEWLDYQVPNATYFAFPRIKDTFPLARDSRKLVYDILEKAKVALVEGVAFGPTGESHVRINFGRSEEHLKEGLTRLGEYFQKGASERRSMSGAQEAGSLASTEQTLSRPQRDFWLRFLTKLSLRNSRAKTIGIIGIRGKTVVRRIIAQQLGEQHEVLSSTLSHNTIAGLCMSLLGISSPTSRLEKVTAFLSAVASAISPKATADLCVLEYGVSDASEVSAYLEVMTPDIVVVTSGIGFDLNVRNERVLAALKEFCKRSGAKQFLIPSDEPWLAEHLELEDAKTLSIPPAVEGACGRSEAMGRAFAQSLMHSPHLS